MCLNDGYYMSHMHAARICATRGEEEQNASGSRGDKGFEYKCGLFIMQASEYKWSVTVVPSSNSNATRKSYTTRTHSCRSIIIIIPVCVCAFVERVQYICVLSVLSAAVGHPWNI